MSLFRENLSTEDAKEDDGEGLVTEDVDEVADHRSQEKTPAFCTGVRKKRRPFAPGIDEWKIAESRPLSTSGAMDPKKIPSRMITDHDQ